MAPTQPVSPSSPPAPNGTTQPGWNLNSLYPQLSKYFKHFKIGSPFL